MSAARGTARTGGAGRPARAGRAASGGPALVAHIDGGARGNPGPAGYGVSVQSSSGDPVAEIYGFLGETTNNVAEYAALLALLEFAVGARVASLAVRSDSQLLVRQIAGEYRVKDPNLKVLHAAARRLMESIPAATVVHVPREENHAADALANLAMDLRTSSHPLPRALRDLPRRPAQPGLFRDRR